MGKRSFLKVLCAVVVSLALGLTTEPLLAQRGGHGGGGGFHGGGGGFHGGGGGGFHGGGGSRVPRWRCLRRRLSWCNWIPQCESRPGLRRLSWSRILRRTRLRLGLWRWTRLGLPGWLGRMGLSRLRMGRLGHRTQLQLWGFWGSGPCVSDPYAYNPWWWAPPTAPPCYYASPCYGPSGYSQADPGSYNPGSYSIDSQDYQENQNNYPTGYSNTDYSNPQSTNYVGPTSQQLAESAVRQIPKLAPKCGMRSEL